MRSTAADPVRDRTGVPGRERHPAVAGYRVSPRVPRRAVVNRQPVRRHHAQRAPGPLQAHLFQMRKNRHRARRQPANDVDTGAVVVADVFVRITDLQRALGRLAYLQGCAGEEVLDPAQQPPLAGLEGAAWAAFESKVLT